PDPIRGPIIRQAFGESAAGRYTKRELLRRASTRGLTTRNGKPLSPQSFNNLLRNPIYSGWINVANWNQSHRGDFEALVSESTFQRPQLSLDGRAPTPKA